ncbi:MAG: hypothetical protein ACP5NQ_06005, partial [Vulcanisaeta sp.]
MKLIMYVPSTAGGFSEVLRINAELIRPSRFIIFTDNINKCGDKLPQVNEIYCINYGGAEALLRMLLIAEVGDVVVNGAILDSSFMQYY